MRKIILFNMVTLDGYFTGPDGELDWHKVDDEFFAFALDQLNDSDELLFGRVTYDMMEAYWTKPEVLIDDPFIAEKMNELPKTVVSRTRSNPTWKKTRMLPSLDEIPRMKEKDGRDILLLGSGEIVTQLAERNLIDEYRLMVCPVVLGKGKVMFNTQTRLALRHLSTRQFRSGNVLLSYAPAG